MRKIFSVVLLLAMPILAIAQSGTNSPYSQYGLGTLSEQAGGFNRGMNGLALGFREHNQVNYLNPASYSSIDSLTFIFDVGMSGQITNFKEGNVRINANNSNLEYFIAGFKARRNLGVSFGVLPYSNVGYNYSSKEFLEASVGASSAYYTNTYSGSGGVRQAHLGMGWEPFKGFSLGANVAYLWGEYNRSVVNKYSDTYINTLTKNYTTEIRNYRLDLGVQYTKALTKKDQLTIGATYTPGHNLKATAVCEVVSQNSQTSVTESTPYEAKNALELPENMAIGAIFNHGNKWKVGADYSLQKWSSVVYPVYTHENNAGNYVAKTGLFSDRHKLTVGGEVCPNERGRKFFDRIHYRVGASYASSYLKINGIDGPKEYSVSAGFGIPIVNSYNNRSLLNISAQWVRQDCPALITENTFRINIGITFNERWFAKWKMD